MSTTSSWSVPPRIPTPVGPYSLGSVTPDGIIHTAGLVAMDPTGGVIGNGDADAQTREIFSQATIILAAANASLRDVIFTHVFVSDMAHYPVMNAAYREMFAESDLPLPPRYCISAGLVKPELLVEIAFVARKGA